MDATSVPASAGAEFFSLSGVIAISAVLLLLGKGADWLLLQQHKEALLAKVSAFGDYLRSVRFKQAQLDLARAMLMFLTAVSVPWTVRRHPNITGRADSELEAGEVFAVMSAFVLRLTHLPLAVIIFGLWAVGLLQFRYGALFVAFAAFLLYRTACWFVIVAADPLPLPENKNYTPPSIFVWLSQSRVFATIDALGGRMLALSFVFSVIAIEIGLAYWSSPRVTAWFTLGDAGPEPAAPLALALLNLPFDVSALMITIMLLNYALSRGKSIALIALVDILTTIVLCWALLVLLTVWPFSDAASWRVARDTVLDAVLRLASFSASTDDVLFPLYPLLFTPFIPIAFYLLIPALLAVLMRPMFLTGGYLCKVFGQKTSSPFVEIASGLVIVVGTVKALSEWPWLVGFLSTRVP